MGGWDILAMSVMTWLIRVCVCVYTHMCVCGRVCICAHAHTLATQLSSASITTREVSLARTQGHEKDTSIIPMSSVWIPVVRTATRFRTGCRGHTPGNWREKEGKEMASQGKGSQQTPLCIHIRRRRMQGPCGVPWHGGSSGHR